MIALRTVLLQYNYVRHLETRRICIPSAYFRQFQRWYAENKRSPNPIQVGKLLVGNQPLNSKPSRIVIFLDKKIGHWKIFRLFFDRPELAVQQQTVYRSNLVTRAELCRGIWLGYFTAALIATALFANINRLGTDCIEHPFSCVLFIGVALSFSIYVSLRARTLVTTIHKRKFAGSPAKDHRGKYRSAPEYVLTGANPFTGMAQKMEFDLEDVQQLEPIQESWPLWRQACHYVNPLKANVIIGKRRFTLESEYFVDDYFYQSIMYRDYYKKATKPS